MKHYYEAFYDRKGIKYWAAEYTSQMFWGRKYGYPFHDTPKLNFGHFLYELY